MPAVSGTYFVKLEKSNYVGESCGLFPHRFRRRGRFFDERGILLRHLVHFRDCGIDLFDTRRLFLARHRYLLDDGGDNGDIAET